MSEEKKEPAASGSGEGEAANAGDAEAKAAASGAEPGAGGAGEAGSAEGAKPAAAADPEREAKLKAAAEARAARAAARAAAESESATNAAAGKIEGAAAEADADMEAKAKAAAEARAARANARAAQKAAEDAAAEATKEPSPLQPRLDRAVELLKQHVAADAVAEAFINEKDGHRPYLVIKAEHWPASARLLKEHEELGLNYMRNLSGTDQETHLEVAYHLISLATKDEYCVKVQADREKPSVPSVAPIWATANWNEREVYDLLGIDFPGHPDLRRIMMPDDWVGYPLRKDYEPIDPEV